MEERTVARQQIDGLNKLLGEIFRTGTRISLLLDELGFTGDQITLLRKEHLAPLVDLILETLRGFIYLRKDADRIWSILCRRFGLAGDRIETLQELADEYGVSREQIRQLELKGIRKLALPRRRAILLDKIKHQCLDWLDPGQDQPDEEIQQAPVIVEAPLSTGKSIPEYVLQKRIHFPRAYEKWSPEEESFLVAQYKLGKTPQELAGLFQRTEYAMVSRLKKLGLIEKDNNDGAMK